MWLWTNKLGLRTVPSIEITNVRYLFCEFELIYSYHTILKMLYAFMR